MANSLYKQSEFKLPYRYSCFQEAVVKLVEKKEMSPIEYDYEVWGTEKDT